MHQTQALFPRMCVIVCKSTGSSFIPMGISMIFVVSAKLLPCLIFGLELPQVHSKILTFAVDFGETVANVLT